MGSKVSCQLDAFLRRNTSLINFKCNVNIVYVISGVPVVWRNIKSPAGAFFAKVEADFRSYLVICNLGIIKKIYRFLVFKICHVNNLVLKRDCCVRH